MLLQDVHKKLNFVFPEKWKAKFRAKQGKCMNWFLQLGVQLLKKKFMRWQKYNVGGLFCKNKFLKGVWNFGRALEGGRVGKIRIKNVDVIYVQLHRNSHKSPSLGRRVWCLKRFCIGCFSHKNLKKKMIMFVCVRSFS